MDITKYENSLKEINIEIGKFNFLFKEPRFATLNISNSNSYSIIANAPWDKRTCPSGNWPGVYVLCASNVGGPNPLGAYVGKATNSNLGDRVFANLNGNCVGDNYRMNDRSGHQFIIEAIVATSVREAHIRGLASALEEFIIHGVQVEDGQTERVHLLNHTGIDT